MEIIKPAIVPEYTEHSAPILEPKPSMEQLEAYLKEHPEYQIPKKDDTPLTAIGNIKKLLANPVVRGILQANPDWINEQIETYGANYKFLIMPWLQQTYPDLYYALNPDENSAGLTNEGNFQGNTHTNQENESYAEFEDSNTISKEVWEEVLSEMVRLSDEGNSPGKIREFIFEDYGIELTHQQIMKDVQRFKQSEKAQRIAEEEERLQQEEEEAELDKARQNASKRILDLIAENKKLTERIHELEKTLAVKEAVESAKNPKPQTETKEQVGLIRAAWKKLY